MDWHVLISSPSILRSYQKKAKKETKILKLHKRVHEIILCTISMDFKVFNLFSECLSMVFIGWCSMRNQESSQQ